MVTDFNFKTNTTFKLKNHNDWRVEFPEKKVLFLKKHQQSQREWGI